MATEWKTKSCRLDEIGRTLRHAQATRRTETDSWLNGYQEDVAYLLEQLESTTQKLLTEVREHDDTRERLDELVEQLEAAHAALTFYADEKTWTQPTSWGGRIIDDEGPWFSDTGKRARDVLYPASSSCDHTWSLPENAGVFRCMKCGVETTDVDALDPASRFIGDSPETHITAPNQERKPRS